MKKTILVTGSKGFVGSNLVTYLLERTEFNIICISRSKMDLDKYQDRLISIEHDLTEKIPVTELEILQKVDYIVHLAGSSCVKTSYEQPLDTIIDNVSLTTNLLDFARSNIPDLKKFLVLSTAEVFGPSKDKYRFKEQDEHNPKSPYALTKSLIGQICHLYYDLYGVPIIVSNIMNIYGKNQKDNKFIPLVARLIKNKEKVSLHASEGPDKRNYLHVDDINSAIIFLLSKGSEGQSYNVVSDKYTDNLEISIMISDLLNRQLDYILVKPQTKNLHHTLSLLDGNKMKELGWSETIDLKEGLRRVLEDE